MKRLLGVACILLSGYVNAQVAHPEDPNIVATIGRFLDEVCFNNDGSVVNDVECDTSPADEGYVISTPFEWNGGIASKINACGIAAIDPVSSATCPTLSGIIAACTPNQFVLVQTTKSGHFFAIRAGDTCGVYNRPETEVIFPCLSSDAFDPVAGCVSTTNPPQISIEAGFIKLDTYGSIPPASQCSGSAHEGRMVVDSINNRFFVCTQSGWTNTLLTVPLP